MEREFELSTILTFITGINLTDNFDKAFDLTRFVFDDDSIDTIGVITLCESVKGHLLSIHPQLIGVYCEENSDINKWMVQQRKEYGDSLLVSRFGEKLNTENERVRKL